MLGFFVSGHPLDEYRDIIRQLTPLYELREGAETYDRKRVYVGGIVNAVRRLMTKNNEQMGFVNVEDFGANVELVVFPKTWNDVHMMMAKDAMIVVEGRVQADERETKIIAEKVYPMESVAAGDIVIGPPRASSPPSAPPPTGQLPAPEEIGRVVLAIDVAHEGVSVSRALAALLQRHHGDIPVRLRVLSSGLEISMAEAYRIDGTPAVIRGLRQLLGEEHVQVEEVAR